MGRSLPIPIITIYFKSTKTISIAPIFVMARRPTMRRFRTREKRRVFRTLQIHVSPTEIVHQIKQGNAWFVLDRWTLPGNESLLGPFWFLPARRRSDVAREFQPLPRLECPLAGLVLPQPPGDTRTMIDGNNRRVRVIDSHTGGEPPRGKVYPSIKGAAFVNADAELLLEPAGSFLYGDSSVTTMKATRTHAALRTTLRHSPQNLRAPGRVNLIGDTPTTTTVSSCPPRSPSQRM